MYINSLRPFPLNRYWIIAIIWASVLLVLSLVVVPGPESAVVLWEDKVTHGVAYAMLALLIVLAFDRRTGSLKRFIPFIVAFLFSVFWGSLTELLQILKSNRSADGADLLADVIGITITLILYWWAVPASMEDIEAIKKGTS